MYLASDGTGITELSCDYCEVEEKSEKGYWVKVKWVEIRKRATFNYRNNSALTVLISGFPKE